MSDAFDQLGVELEEVGTYTQREFKRMYDELTDPDLIEENRVKAARKKRIEDGKRDTGL